jgi:hypothetical protein
MGEPVPHINDVKDLERYPRDRKPMGLLWPLAFVAAFAAVGWYFVTR